MNHSPTIHLSEDHTMQSAGDGAEILNFSRTLERVSARTIELAGLDGRPAHQIRQGDYERAKREIAASHTHDRFWGYTLWISPPHLTMFPVF